MAVIDQERDWHGRYVSTGNACTVVGLDDVAATLKRLQTSHPQMHKDINKIISYVIKKARSEVMKSIKGDLGSDPRKAYLAVKSMVYKRMFGGNVNIISRRHNNGKMYVGEKPRKLVPGQRGGNRRKRSEKTIRMDSYYGSDRGFILRWINSGTSTRRIRTGVNTAVNKGVGKGHTSASLEGQRNGYRGQLHETGNFATSSQAQMEAAAGRLAGYIEEAIEQIWGSTADLAKVKNQDFA